MFPLQGGLILGYILLRLLCDSTYRTVRRNEETGNIPSFITECYCTSVCTCN